MAGEAVQEVVLESTLVSRPGLAPTQLLLPERVQLVQLPLYRPARFLVHAEVEPGQYGDFTMLQQQPYKVRASDTLRLLPAAAELKAHLLGQDVCSKHQPLQLGMPAQQ
jgi:hypothetical protein